jgi:hypothetical protein
MHRSQGWGLSRYAALMTVLAVHLALLALMLSQTRTSSLVSPANDPVELVYLPPPQIPKIRAETSPPRRLSGATAIWLSPPVLESDSAALTPTAASSDGDGSGVDWKAEAGRAVQAFEIRSHRPRSDYSMPGDAAEEKWWPRSRHRVGEQFKTAGGDWIVWVSETCYQIASSKANALAPGATTPQTICSRDAAAASAKAAADRAK